MKIVCAPAQTTPSTIRRAASASRATSELQPQCQLQVSGIAVQAADSPISRPADGRRRHAQVHPIEQIRGLRTEQHADRFPYRKRFLYREIGLRESRPVEDID